MGRASKVVLWLVVAVVAVFLVATIAFRLFFDPNDFREEIAAAVKERTGRELVIEGDVDVQVFPWLAIEIGATTLGNAPGFGDEPFLAFDRAKLSVQFLPLVMGGNVSVGTAELEGLRVSLAVNGRDERNWSDFLATEDDGAAVETTTENVAADAASTGGTFEIDGLALRNATISYVHEPKGDAYSFTDVNLEIGRIAGSGDEVPVSGGLTFDVQPAGYSGSMELETSVSFDTEAGTVIFGDSSLEATLAGIATEPTRLSFATAGIAVDTVDKVTTLEPIELSILGIDLDATVEPFSYADAITPKAAIKIDAFSPRSLMRLLGVAPPATADPAALSLVIIEANAEMAEDLVRLTGLSIKLDDTSFTGSMTVPFNSNGRFFARLDGDAIDLNRYMEPPAEDAAGADDGAAPVEIPVDLLRPLNVRGELTLQRVTMGALPLEDVTVTVNARDGKLRIYPISSNLFGGSYNGDISIDTSGSLPVLAVNESVQGVDLGQLALAMFEQENVTGSIAGNFKLTGRGHDMAAIQRSLNGSMSFELLDGTYEGTDIWYELRRARALIKQETPPEPTLPARTKFSKVTASGAVRDGIMRNEDLVAELPFMQLTGSGDVNLPEGTVDYGLRARIYSKPEAMDGATAEEIDDLTKTVIPLTITGSLASPTVRPDVEALLRQKVEDKVKEKIEDKLKDLFKR